MKKEKVTDDLVKKMKTPVGKLVARHLVARDSAKEEGEVGTTFEDLKREIRLATERVEKIKAENEELRGMLFDFYREEITSEELRKKILHKFFMT